jgi:hypothetical protein
MSLSGDLLELAQHLARRERGRPRQSSLRRSVSTAYYALFHFLVDESTRWLLGASGQTAHMRAVAARAYHHAEMRRACSRFRTAVLDRAPWGAPGRMLTIPTEARNLAETFVLTQEERHRADYDAGFRFTRSRALALVQRVHADMSAWRQARGDPAAHRLLLDLLLGSRLRTS